MILYRPPVTGGLSSFDHLFFPCLCKASNAFPFVPAPGSLLSPYRWSAVWGLSSLCLVGSMFLAGHRIGHAGCPAGVGARADGPFSHRPEYVGLGKPMVTDAGTGTFPTRRRRRLRQLPKRALSISTRLRCGPPCRRPSSITMTAAISCPTMPNVPIRGR